MDLKSMKKHGAMGRRGFLILALMALMSVTSIFSLIGHVAGANVWQASTVIPTETTASAYMPSIKLDTLTIRVDKVGHFAQAGR